MNKTTVCNVRVANIRPKYNNLKEWMKDDGNVYIGRKGIVFIDGIRFPSIDSVWANPYKVTDQCSRETALEKYRTYIVEKITSGKVNLLALKVKQLGCWCCPLPCHGNVLIDLMNEYKVY